jgi:predicted CXXCH cytochrome family protein
MAQVKFMHKAVSEGDCMNCHDAHASDFAMQIKQSPEQLCTSCHAQVKKDALEASHRHTVVIKDKACLNCHTAHGGDLAKLLRNDEIKVCLKCHEKKIDAGGGKTIASVAEVLDPKKSKHGPIRNGDCAGCHNVHGSEISRLLRKPYPEAFYQGFSLDKYELCFSCHEKQLVLLEKTEGLTNFRNGAENLHFVHVNKTDKGRNCRACHETHASAQDLHVRDTTPFGKWQMPINFKKTETGGSCAPGCHKQYGYDRKTPATYNREPQQQQEAKP